MYTNTGQWTYKGLHGQIEMNFQTLPTTWRRSHCDSLYRVCVCVCVKNFLNPDALCVDELFLRMWSLTTLMHTGSAVWCRFWGTVTQLSSEWLESNIFHYLTLIVGLKWSSISSSDQVSVHWNYSEVVSDRWRDVLWIKLMNERPCAELLSANSPDLSKVRCLNTGRAVKYHCCEFL